MCPLGEVGRCFLSDQVCDHLRDADPDGKHVVPPANVVLLSTYLIVRLVLDKDRIQVLTLPASASTIKGDNESMGIYAISNAIKRQFMQAISFIAPSVASHTDQSSGAVML